MYAAGSSSRSYEAAAFKPYLGIAKSRVRAFFLWLMFYSFSRFTIATRIFTEHHFSVSKRFRLPYRGDHQYSTSDTF